MGPLQVCEQNPRYFATPDGQAVYLTGSHTWNNLQDISSTDPLTPFDFDDYLDFLQRHHHNFVRLWRFEATQWDTRGKESQHFTDQQVLLRLAPFPWKRTGPGLALDGYPKFNLEEFDPEYFARLRYRVEAARQRGIYVSVMLFEGFSVWAMRHAWETHPFNPQNNINGVNGDTDGDGLGIETQLLASAEVTRLQETYVRHVIDTLNDLDNVLYEIANESRAASYPWQAHLVQFIQEYQRTKALQHPVGMTFLMGPNSQWLESDQKLFQSPAEWISPSRNAPDGYAYRTNPPPADGTKVIIADTDHFFGIGGDYHWVWKAFTRGHNPIFMDPWDNSVLGKPATETWDPLRQSLGQTRLLASELDLNRLVPHGDLASSQYCLAIPGRDYVAYLPEGRDLTVDLTAAVGELSATWIHPVDGTRLSVDDVAGGTPIPLTAPWDGGAVLLLRHIPSDGRETGRPARNQ